MIRVILFRSRDLMTKSGMMRIRSHCRLEFGIEPTHILQARRNIIDGIVEHATK